MFFFQVFWVGTPKKKSVKNYWMWNWDADTKIV